MGITIKAASVVDDYRQIFLDDRPLLDVRSPQEFIEASVPGAINIPLLDDQQRHLVGVEYQREGKEDAIKLGARLLDQQQREKRIDRWAAFAQNHSSTVLYCARGGLRSNISGSWLADAGVDVPVVKGGYKAMRQFLLQSLEQNVPKLPLIIVGGRTGIGKTGFLKTLPRHLDLEHLANHRGSSFGRVASPQPSNANFSSAVAIALLKLEAASHHTVFIEDEARMVGSNSVPEVLFEAMRVAPMILLDESLPVRVDNVVNDYVIKLLALYQAELGQEAGFAAFESRHLESLHRVRKRFGSDNYTKALAMGQEALRLHRELNDVSGYKPLIEMLLSDYYDPMYDYQLQAKADRVVAQGDAATLMQWCHNNDVVHH